MGSNNFFLDNQDKSQVALSLTEFKNGGYSSVRA